MSNEESKSDVVKEARELLANAAHGPLQLIRYDHGGGRLYREKPRDLIADFYDAGNREFYSRAREIVSALCNEVEELRRRNATQEESIMEFQEEQRAMQAAIEATNQWFTEHFTEIPCTIPIGPITALLRSAITPKGSDQSGQ